MNNQETAEKKGWTELWITDKSGQKMFSVLCGTPYKMSEFRNLCNHLTNAKKSPKHYSFLDIETATIEERDF